MIGFYAAGAMGQGGGGGMWTPANMALPPAVWVGWDTGIVDVAGAAAEWENRGELGGSFTQSLGARRPQIIAGGLNGHRILRFSGNVLVEPPAVRGMMRNVAGGWIFTVAKKSVSDPSPASRRVLAWTTPANAARFGIYWDDSVGTSANLVVVGARRLDSDSYQRAQSAVSHSGSWLSAFGQVDYVGRTLSLYINDTLSGHLSTAFGGSGTSSNTDSAEAGIGGTAAAGSTFEGDIACCIAGAGGPLTESDRQRLAGYAHHALGLQDQLSADHPFRHAPPYVNTPVLQPSFAASPAVYGFVAATDSGDIGVAAGPAVATAFGTLLDPEPTLGGGQGITTASASGTLTVRLDGIAPATTPAEAIVMDHQGGHIATVALSDGGGYYSGSASASLTNGGVYYVRVQAA